MYSLASESYFSPMLSTPTLEDSDLSPRLSALDLGSVGLCFGSAVRTEAGEMLDFDDDPVLRTPSSSRSASSHVLPTPTPPCPLSLDFTEFFTAPESLSPSIVPSDSALESPFDLSTPTFRTLAGDKASQSAFPLDCGPPQSLLVDSTEFAPSPLRSDAYWLDGTPNDLGLLWAGSAQGDAGAMNMGVPPHLLHSDVPPTPSPGTSSCVLPPLPHAPAANAPLFSPCVDLECRIPPTPTFDEDLPLERHPLASPAPLDLQYHASPAAPSDDEDDDGEYVPSKPKPRGPPRGASGRQARPRYHPYAAASRNAQTSARTPRASPNACPHCDFVQTNGRAPDLRRHIGTHGKKMFRCAGVAQCQQSFSRMDALKRHWRNSKVPCTGVDGQLKW